MAITCRHFVTERGRWTAEIPANRYQRWNDELGTQISNGGESLQSLHDRAMTGQEPSLGILHIKKWPLILNLNLQTDELVPPWKRLGTSMILVHRYFGVITSHETVTGIAESQNSDSYYESRTGTGVAESRSDGRQ